MPFLAYTHGVHKNSSLSEEAIYEMNKRIQAVILDWAGTTVDYGCFAPMHALLQTFEKAGVPATIQEARAPMGLLKRDHIQAMLDMSRVKDAWSAAYGRSPATEDADRLYDAFETALSKSLSSYADPMPEALEAIALLRQSGIRIGSTTGYTKSMMDVIAPIAQSKGYAPDALVCADEVKAGRPAPYMIFRNMIELDVYPPQAVVKVGDTVSDVKEALNAGVWSVAVVKGGSELGLTREEVESMPPAELSVRMDRVRQTFAEAGAHLVLDAIDGLPAAVEQLGRR